MLIGWIDATKSKEFGEELAKFLVSRIPSDQRIKEKKFAVKTQKVLGKAALQVFAFKRQNKLNFYKRAQLGNTFKWTLKEAGFDQNYIKQLSDWLMMNLF